MSRMQSRRTKSSVAACALLVALASGCASGKPYVWVDDLPAAAADTEHRIRPNDKLFLVVTGQESLTGEVQVREDGCLVQPVLGKLCIEGLTTREASERIRERLRGMVVNPDVVLAVVATSPSRVSVVGEVEHPGQFDVDRAEGVLNALARAGGLTEFANKDGIFVIRRSPEGKRVRFRYSDLTGGDEKSIAFRLQDGDVVVVE